jgi:hypothetical protein
MKNIKTTHIIILILLVLLVITFLESLKSDKELKQTKEKYGIEILRNQSLLDSITNKNGEIVKLQGAVVFEDKKLLSRYTDSIFALRKKDAKKYKETLAFYQNYIDTYLPDTVYSEVFDTTEVKPISDNPEVQYYIDNSISVPKEFKIDSNYFKLGGIVTKTNVGITSLSLPDTISGRFIEKKEGFLKRKSIEYQLTNTNPYVNIQGSKSAIYKEPKKKFWGRVAKVAAYIGIGFLTSQLIK